jgi:hypothetical protein
MSKVKTKAAEEITLRESVKAAIEEQQARVWRLRNLIECVRQAADSSDDVEDFGAAITGLQDYANDTYYALDAGIILQRAQMIEEEERHAVVLAAREAGAARELAELAANSEETPTQP